MEPQICPKTPGCPIFNGILKGTQYTETYKKLYCEAGEEGRTRCKRYQVVMAAGKCSDNILPNSTISVEEIISRMKTNGEIE